MSNERYCDFLRFSLQRMLETALFYETQAKQCADQNHKLFLYFLAGRKRVQYVVLEKMNIGIRTVPAGSDVNCLTFPDLLPEQTPLNLQPTEGLLAFVQKRARSEFNLFLDLATLEEDDQTKKLLITLCKLSREYLCDATNGFELFATKSVLRDFPVTQEMAPVLAQA